MKPNDLNIPQYVQDGIRKVAQTLQFSHQFTVDYDFRTDGHYSSACVSVRYQITLREEPRELTLLCKVPPPDADDTLLALFEREVFVYQQLLPTFGQFQQERDIAPTSAEFAYAPICYYAYYDPKRREGILILEDASRRMFGNRNKYKPIDYDHGRLAMIQLGRFHAVSLIMKEQHPKIFERFQRLEDVTADRVMSMEGFKETMELSFNHAIGTLSVHETNKKDKLNKLKNSFVEELKTIADSELSEPFCVICHGDYSKSNVMYSYNGGFPSKLVMLDWQLAKYGSPALDFLHFMFLSTDESFRRLHYDNMLQTYQNALRDHMERLGGDNATERFPLTTLMRLIRSQAKYSVTLAVLHIPLMITCAGEEDDDEIKDGKEHNENGIDRRESGSYDAIYQARMNGLLKDIFRLGYL
ncbi:uncharacterized protein LOC131685638 [Topomyia yanbarensis]|uniref:uncharacterized protein LOC131685638 n=1 Tax=Topomyia yanbarensis TaxID=2498891 RepID=UPI00273CD3AC|nr:uncharacterized protein LOC131685638 [Topomyia yanbarensis]